MPDHLSGFAADVRKQRVLFARRIRALTAAIAAIDADPDLPAAAKARRTEPIRTKIRQEYTAHSAKATEIVDQARKEYLANKPEVTRRRAAFKDPVRATAIREVAEHANAKELRALAELASAQADEVAAYGVILAMHANVAKLDDDVRADIAKLLNGMTYEASRQTMAEYAVAQREALSLDDDNDVLPAGGAVNDPLAMIKRANAATILPHGDGESTSISDAELSAFYDRVGLSMKALSDAALDVAA
jgi:hypothetical protein